MAFSSLSYLHPPIFYFLSRAFTVTAIAQTCILGLMWVFGAFLFQKDAIVVAYIFTILNSLQGALVFVMHCLLSKQVQIRVVVSYWIPFTGNYTLDQCACFPLSFVLCSQVREEYAHFLSCICMSQKKRYSDFSSTNPSSSQLQVSTAHVRSNRVKLKLYFCQEINLVFKSVVWS